MHDVICFHAVKPGAIVQLYRVLVDPNHKLNVIGRGQIAPKQQLFFIKMNLAELPQCSSQVRDRFRKKK